MSQVLVFLLLARAAQRTNKLRSPKPDPKVVARSPKLNGLAGAEDSQYVLIEWLWAAEMSPQMLPRPEVWPSS